MVWPIPRHSTARGCVDRPSNWYGLWCVRHSSVLAVLRSGTRKASPASKPCWGVRAQSKDAFRRRNDPIVPSDQYSMRPSAREGRSRSAWWVPPQELERRNEEQEHQRWLEERVELSNRGRQGRLELGGTLRPSRFPFTHEDQREFGHLL